MIYFYAAAFSICMTIGISRQNEISRIRSKKLVIRIKDVRLFIAAIPPFFLSALRYGIGTDYFFTYVPAFNMVLKGSGEYRELGFTLLNKIITMFTSDYQWLFIVTSFLFIYFVYAGIYKLSENYPVSITLLFLSYAYFISLNNVRQSLASAIAFFALSCLKEGNRKNYIILIILAASIHQSAVIYMIFLFIDRFNISIKACVSILIISLTANQWVGPLLMTRLARWNSWFNIYVTRRMFMDATIGTPFLLTQICIFLMILFLEWGNFLQNKDSFNLKLTRTVQLCIMLCCAIDGFFPAMYRVVRLFSFMQIVTVPNILEELKNKWMKFICYVAVMAVYILLCIYSIQSGTEAVLPYQSIFGK